MFLRPAIACAIAVSAAFGGIAAQPAAPAVTVSSEHLSADDRERVDRATAVSSERYDEWLGPPTRTDQRTVRLTRPYWSSAASMDLESQVAFELARARFAALAGSAVMQRFVDGVAWHLQSRVVEQLFDLAQHQPGHHAVDVRLFGDHVRWGVPSLVLSADARDERAAAPIAHAAAAVATLEQLVGFPALAAALRVVSSSGAPSLESEAVAGLLEAALGVPLGWFFAALDPALHVNYRLASVTTRREACGGQVCHRVVVTVASDGPPLFANPATSIVNPMPLRIDFTGAEPLTILWSGREATKTFTIESPHAPDSVVLDPHRAVRLDDNPLDQRWRATGAHHPRPAKSLAAWIVWLQNAALTYAVLL